MAEASWKRISDKRYQRLVGEEWRTVEMPYGKVEMIFDEFVGEGGIVDPATGLVSTELPTLIRKFGRIGGIVLTEFNERGEVVQEGNCKALDPSEIPPLFEIAVDVIENFTRVISVMRGMARAPEMANPAAEATAA